METLTFREPRLAALILLVVVAAGLSALFSIGRQEDPTITNLFATVTTAYPGADAARVEALVTTASPAATEALVRRLEQEAGALAPEAQMLVRGLVQGPPVTAPVELRLVGPDIETWRALGAELRRIVSAVPSVTVVRGTIVAGGPEVGIAVDEATARSMGLTLGDVARQLETSLEGVTGGSLVEGTQELPVRVGTVRNFVCGPWVDHGYQAARRRSSKRMANWAFAMAHSLGGILHSFSARFKTRNRSFMALSSFGKWPRVRLRNLMSGNSLVALSSIRGVPVDVGLR